MRRETIVTMVKPELLKSWTLEMKLIIAELRVFVLTKRQVGSGTEIGSAVVVNPFD